MSSFDIDIRQAKVLQFFWPSQMVKFKILEKEAVMERTQSKQAEGAITKEVLLTQVKAGSFTVEEFCRLFNNTPIDEVRLAVLGRLKHCPPCGDFPDWLLTRVGQFAQRGEWNVFAGLLRCAHSIDVRDVNFSEGITNQLVDVLAKNFALPEDAVKNFFTLHEHTAFTGNIPIKDYNDLLVILCGAMIHHFSLYTWRVKDFFRKVLEKEDWFLPELLGIVKRILRVIGCMGDTSFLALLRERGCKPIKVPPYGFSTFFEFPDSYQQIIETEGLRLMVIRHLEILENLPK